ncbi:MAG: hypothetical protein NZ700_05670 [Gemmataceae bacterium]|nr:hypothetical protein [Gemmataceae bacterium]MDW8264746.1 AsmA-like C-terminal region-containing protein [Gemmataceae bacterium]
MSWRKWLVRGLVFFMLGGLAIAVGAYQHWTNPSAVRLQVIHQVQQHCIGAYVSVDTARLRLLGGISVTDLRLTRRDDPDKVDFLYVPEGIIYHDKEQLLHGELVIRKLELYRPRFRVIRDREGRWNLRHILGPVDPNKPIPTIVIRQGTILFEDRGLGDDRPTDGSANPTPVVRLEIKDVNVTLLNDPVPLVHIQGRGVADLIGAVQLQAEWHRVAGGISLRLQAPSIPVRWPLVQWLTHYQPKLAEHARQLEGIGRLELACQYRPDHPQPWTHDVRWQLTQGSLRHPLIPLPLHQIDLAVRCVDGHLTLDRCTARSGPATVELKGWARLDDPRPTAARVASEPLTPRPGTLTPEEPDFEGDLRINHLPVTPEMFAPLPEVLRDIGTCYRPQGEAHLRFRFGRRQGRWRRQLTVQPLGMEVTCQRFPYTLEQLQGSVEYRQDEVSQVEEVSLQLVGYSARRPVSIRGTVHGTGPTAGVQVEIWADDLPLDGKLEAALPAEFRALARSFHPTGKVDVVARLWRPTGAREFLNHIIARFHHATICYDIFPYPLEEVTGILEIQPGRWEFRDFHGTHKGGEIHGRAQSQPMPTGDRVILELHGKNLLLDEELEAALVPKLRAVWRTLAPTGRMNFSAHVDNLPGQPQDVDVSVTVRDIGLKPSFFPCVFTDVTGTFRYVDDQVHIGRFRARHGATVIGFEQGTVLLKPEGGFYAKFDRFSGDPIVPTASLVQAAPPALRRMIEAMELRDPLTLTTQLVIDLPPEAGTPPVVYWDGGLAVRGASLRLGVPFRDVTGQLHCRGRHNGRRFEGVLGNVLIEQATLFNQPFQQIHTHVQVPPDCPDVIRFPDLKAKFFGGDLGGEVRIELGPTLRYDLNLSLVQMRLEEFGRHNLGDKAEVSGPLTARLYLEGRGPGIDGLEGRGSIEVRHGRIYNLPFPLDLVKLMTLRPPDRTAFEEAYAAFTIRSSRVTIARLDFYGNAISLSGQGEMNLDGTDVNLDFYAVWGRMTQVLPPLVRVVPSALGQSLLKVKMRGNIGDLKITKEPVPVLVEPMERLLRRLSGGEGRPATTGLTRERPSSAPSGMAVAAPQ